MSPHRFCRTLKLPLFHQWKNTFSQWMHVYMSTFRKSLAVTNKRPSSHQCVILQYLPYIHVYCSLKVKYVGKKWNYKRNVEVSLNESSPPNPPPSFRDAVMLVPLFWESTVNMTSFTVMESITLQRQPSVGFRFISLSTTFGVVELYQDQSKYWSSLPLLMM